MGLASDTMADRRSAADQGPAYNGGAELGRFLFMDDRLTKLSEKARALPKAPGVYLMKDDKGRVIYVGKSASLRERVASYFQASDPA